MHGNDKLSELVSYLDTKNYKFSGSFRRSIGAGRVLDLRKRIEAERASGYSETVARYREAFLDPKIQEAFQLKDGRVIDLTEDLDLQNGRVYALCLNEVGPTHSLKDPVMAGLFLMNLMTPGIPIEDMDTIADVGIWNSFNRARNLAHEFGLRLEWYAPSEMEHIFKDCSTPDFSAYPVRIFSEDMRFAGKEKEAKNACYETLFERLIKDKDFARRTFYLGHSELGWAAMYPVAERNADLLDSMGIKPTILYSCIGAGTFFVPHAEVFNQRFGTKPVLGEYAAFHPMTDAHGLEGEIVEGMPAYISKENAQIARRRNNSGRAVISRKFAENPFIPKSFWTLIEKYKKSYLMGEDPADLATVLHMSDKGKDIGITTGGVIAVASELANKGETVVVPFYEKYKDYAARLQYHDAVTRIFSFYPGFSKRKLPVKIAAVAAAAMYAATIGYWYLSMLANNNIPYFDGFTLVK